VLRALLVGLAFASPQADASAFPYINCLSRDGTRYVRKRKPARCAHFGPGGSFGGGVNLRDIHWRSYTGSEARGTATECGFHLPCANVRVTIRAYRVRRACGRHVYTRLRARSRYGTTLVRLVRCPGRAY
jgi:hypothetical protein